MKSNLVLAGQFSQILIDLMVRLFRKPFGIDLPEYYIRKEKQKPKESATGISEPPTP